MAVVNSTCHYGGHITIPNLEINTLFKTGGAVEKEQTIEVIEDLLPLLDTHVSMTFDKTVKNVFLEPEGKEITYQHSIFDCR